MNIRFGIDLDGVLANFVSSTIKIASSIWPDKLAEDYLPPNWGFSDVFSKEDWDKVWTEIKATPNFWTKEQPYVDNVNALLNFDKLAEIYFITSRIETMGCSVLTQSTAWLAKQGLRSYNTSVIPVADAKHKAAMCAGLKLPFMLDDYGPTVQSLQNVEGLRAYVLDQPWNQEYKELPRVYSVAEYLEVVKKG